MINPDELELAKPATKPKDLTVMSVGDLQDYIQSLESEIGRARDAIAKKQAHKDAIGALFKV